MYPVRQSHPAIFHWLILYILVLPVTYMLACFSDCRYRVIESSSLVSVRFREVFSHPYISFFHLLVNNFSVIFRSVEDRVVNIDYFLST